MLRLLAPPAILLAIAVGFLSPASLAQETNAPGLAATNVPPAATPPLFDAALTNAAVNPTLPSATNGSPVTAAVTPDASTNQVLVSAATTTNAAPPLSTNAVSTPTTTPNAPLLAPSPATTPLTASTPLIASPQGPASPSTLANSPLVIDTASAASPSTSPTTSPAADINTVAATTLPVTSTNSVVAVPSAATNALVVTQPAVTGTNTAVVSPATNAPPLSALTNTVTVPASTTATTNPPSDPSATNLAIQPFIQSPQVFLSDAGYNLIVYYESGGQSYFVNSGQQYPTWPQGDSGVTVGIGVDLGYTLSSRVISDWSGRIPDPSPARLSRVAGLTGSAAQSAISQVRDILINWNISVDEFENVEVPDEVSLTKQVFPGAEQLRLNAISALVATVYNRGTSLVGSSRVDMRTLRQLVPNKDYEGMAEALEHMVVTMGPAWKSEGVYAGLRERYLATAKLMRTP